MESAGARGAKGEPAGTGRGGGPLTKPAHPRQSPKPRPLASLSNRKPAQSRGQPFRNWLPNPPMGAQEDLPATSGARFQTARHSQLRAEFSTKLEKGGDFRRHAPPRAGTAPPAQPAFRRRLKEAAAPQWPRHRWVRLWRGRNERIRVLGKGVC